ncbi:threonylcarbamoyl-AMP synthase [Candidatus Parcubacteria bacterium]|nr:MAG: threonylcarbamoyl-AMP synthase [Candidatus Parcubacteria bacterium]
MAKINNKLIYINLRDFFKSEKNQNEIITSIKNGGIIIYPTDTIYGIGCDATNKKAVLRLNKAKQRKPGQPFSLIAPSINWIYKHTTIKKYAIKYLKRLPGRYTFILKAKPSIKHLVTKGAVGVRIPKHKFTDIIRKHKILLITTSVNLSGQPPARSVREMPARLKKAASHIINAGQFGGKPSTIIDLTGQKPKKIR